MASTLLASFLSSILFSPMTVGPYLDQNVHQSSSSISTRPSFTSSLESIFPSFYGYQVRADMSRMFNNFLSKYGKRYESGSQEYLHRMEIFQESMKRVQKLNDQRSHSESAFYGINYFSDLTPIEFQQKHLSKNHVRNKSNHEHHDKNFKIIKSSQSSYVRIKRSQNKDDIFLRGRKRQISTSSSHNSIRMSGKNTVPLRIDWRASGVVTPVRNQGKCGACWAYSTIETIESMAAIQSGKRASDLSVQQIIDCATSDNHGCDGGDTCSALLWMKKNSIKIVTSSEYPMRDESGSCRLPSAEFGVVVKNFTCDSFIGSEEEMIKLLAFHGPLTVAVDATSWQDYLGGIIQYHCDPNRNHAVQIVGYDLSGDIPYFIVRNTWGPNYGVDGYLKIAIGKNLCGIAEEVSSIDVE